MSKEVFSHHDSADYLKTEEDIAAYLEEAAETGNDPADLARVSPAISDFFIITIRTGSPFGSVSTRSA